MYSEPPVPGDWATAESLRQTLRFRANISAARGAATGTRRTSFAVTRVRDDAARQANAEPA